MAANFISIILIFTIIGCGKSKPKPKRVLTELQAEYLSKIELEKKVYMEDCLSYETRDFSYCQEKMAKSIGSKTVINNSGGSSIGETAVGTAAGIGAAKIIFGK